MFKNLLFLLLLLPVLAFGQTDPQPPNYLVKPMSSYWTIVSGDSSLNININGKWINVVGRNWLSHHAITLTTTGTSGPATYSGGVLNIPQYSGGSSLTANNGIAITSSVIQLGGALTKNTTIGNSGFRLTADSLYLQVTSLPPSTGGYMVVFGDSWGAGSVATDTTRDYVNIVANKMGWGLRNYSASGAVLEKRTPVSPFIGYNMVDDTTAIPTYVAGTSRLAIIQLGINDWAYGGGNYTPTNYKTDYEKVIPAFFHKGWPASKLLIINLGYTDPSLFGSVGLGGSARTAATKAAFNAQALAVSVEFNVPYFDAYTWILNHGANATNGNTLHMNNKGHEIYAQGILNILQTQVYRRAQSLAANGKVEVIQLVDNTHSVLPTYTRNEIIGRDSAGNVATLSTIPGQYLLQYPNVSVSSATQTGTGIVHAPNMLVTAGGETVTGVANTPTFVIGGIAGGFIYAGGSSYTNGTYTAVPVVGGTGSGCITTVVVSGGAVSGFTITTAGTGYTQGDLVSVDPSSVGGTGSAFQYYVSKGTYVGTYYGFTTSGIPFDGGPGAGNNPLVFNNIRMGYQALSSITTGARNFGAMTLSLGNATTATDNIGLGVSTLAACTTCQVNFAMMTGALAALTDGTQNIAIGQSAMANPIHTNYTNVIGGLAGLNIGSYSNIMGYNAGRAGIDNDVQAYQGLGSNIDASDMQVRGYNAFFSLQHGSSSIADGTYAGLWAGGGTSIDLTTVNNSIFIGERTEPLVNNGTDENVIGYHATGNGSHTSTIGNTSNIGNYTYGTTFLPAGTTSLASLNVGAGVAPTSPNNGDIWSTSSHLFYRIGGASYQLDQQGGGGAGTVTSITPGYGHTSSTPITTIGTLTIDSTILVNKTFYNSVIGTAANTKIATKQATLVSGTNIKTVNSTTLLGSGNLAITTANTDTTGTGFATQASLIPYQTKAQNIAAYLPINSPTVGSGTTLTLSGSTTNAPVVFGFNTLTTSPVNNSLEHDGTNFYYTTNAAARRTVVNTNTAQTLSGKSMSGAANTFTLIPLTTAVTGILPPANGGTGVVNSKNLTVSNSLTLAGTDATTMTFPSTSATIARTDAAQTFTGSQTFSSVAVFSGGLGTVNSSNANFNVASGVAISGGTTNASLIFGGGSTVMYRGVFNGTTTGTLGTGNVYGNLIVGNDPITTFTSGTHPVLANVVLKGLGTVTSGGATVTETDAVRVEGTGTSIGGVNYALRALNGLSRIDSMQVKQLNLNGAYGTNGQVPVFNGTTMAWVNINTGLITGTPTIAAGAGAGTSPTISVTTNGKQLQVTITTGTLPTGTNATIATVTLPNALSYTPLPVFSSASAATALLNGASMIFMTSTGTANVTITSGTTALTAATTYVWNVSL